MYYFIELAGSVTNIALLSLFMSRLFVRNKIQSKWHSAFLTLLCTGQCVLSLFPNWVIPRTLYLLLGGFLLARLFYEVQTWPAAFASGSFFVLGSVVEILAMLLIGVRLPDTDLLMQAGAVRVIYVVFSNLIQIPLLILVSHFFNREESDLRIVWLFPLISIQLASISVCYVVQCHAADKDFPDYMVFFIAVLLFVNIMIVFYVEALRKNEKEKYNAASCIKIFILIELFNRIQKGEIDRKFELEYLNKYYVNGSGVLQYLSKNIKLPIIDIATLMMIISDNVATNILIDYLGIDNINKTIKNIGCLDTELFSMFKSVEDEVFSETTAYDYYLVWKKLNNNELFNEKITSVSTIYENYILTILIKDFKDDYYLSDEYVYSQGRKISNLIFNEYLKLGAKNERSETIGK